MYDKKYSKCKSLSKYEEDAHRWLQTQIGGGKDENSALEWSI